jgi:hypothetical protein
VLSMSIEKDTHLRTLPLRRIMRPWVAAFTFAT